MLNFIRATKFAAVVAATALLAASTPSQAQQGGTGSVRLNIVKAGFIVGAGGGSGTLNFKGKTYRLSVGGVGLGSLGVASASLRGTARNLRSASDIAGTYGGVGGGAAVVGGGQVATLQNEKGVVLQLSGVQAGLQVSLGLGGMTITMQ